MSEPDISVVMSVHNGGSYLRKTMISVLSQEDAKLEFIIVNDGSTDNTGEILEAYAANDTRIRTIHQNNTGLTYALIRGCAMARGEFIARQDCGDLSLPGRLLKQAQILKAHPNIAMTSCGTRFTGPLNEFLYDVRQTSDELRVGLERLDLKRVRGPSHHGSVMFRRNAYMGVGGYRRHFRLAQDLDLWLRLSEVRDVHADAEVLYEARLLKGAISLFRRAEQLRIAEIILRCASARRIGIGEVGIIRSASLATPRTKRPLWPQRYLDEARFYYFIGSVLSSRDPQQGGRYYRRALRSWVLHLPALYKLLRLGLPR